LPMRSFLVMLIFALVGVMQVNAQPTMKEKARHVISRTAHVIYAAHKATVAHHQFTGNLQRAVVHQRLAINFYRDGKYGKAIAHSIRARELAIRHIQTLSEQVPQGFEITNDERVPVDEDVNKEISTEAEQYLKSFNIPNDESLSKQSTIDGIELSKDE